MNWIAVLFVLLLGLGLTSCAAVGGSAVTAGTDQPVAWPTVAEKIRAGEIPVGDKADEAYGMTPDGRYHQVHARALGLQCATCHAAEQPPGQAVFATAPAADVSPESPSPVDRRSCLGCHLRGPGRSLYGP